MKFLNCSILFFTDLRMELLDGETNNDLFDALQALLMLLPQSNAFRILRDRLNCLQRVSPNSNRYLHHISIIHNRNKYRFPCFLWIKTKIYTELYYSVSLNISTKSNKLTSRKSPGANGIIACRFGSEEIDFHALLNHFKSVQQNHLDLLRAQSQEQQLTRGVKILDLSDSEESDDREDSETNKYSL